MNLCTMFKAHKPIISMLHSMLHVPALPGSPGHELSFTEIRDWVLTDAEALASGGVDGLILENFGDTPFYPSRVPPHTVAFLTMLGYEVKTQFALPLGINVLRNDAASALAIATAVGAQFVRVNVYTGARVTDQGILQGQAHRLLRYRKLLGSQVQVFADVAVKHSAPLGQRDLQNEVEDTVARGRADAIIVSGPATGKETSIEDLQAAKEAAGDTPVLIGSGVHILLGNLARLLACADGLIVGTGFKYGRLTSNRVDPSRVREFIAALKGFR